MHMRNKYATIPRYNRGPQRRTLMPFTQNDVKQCWANAYASLAAYRVPVESLKEAIALRAQCHRLRKKEADVLYPARPDDYFLDELEIVLENKCVIFQRKRKLNL